MSAFVRPMKATVARPLGTKKTKKGKGAVPPFADELVVS
jgi:hypothetical protein